METLGFLEDTTVEMTISNTRVRPGSQGKHTALRGQTAHTSGKMTLLLFCREFPISNLVLIHIHHSLLDSLSQLGSDLMTTRPFLNAVLEGAMCGGSGKNCYQR